MFVGRKEELSILEAAYESESFQMMVVYGRRRVGKTSLIRKFAENKSNVYFFTALEANAQENLRAFSKAILTSEPRGLDYPHGYPFDYAPTPAPSFNSFEDALTYIFRQSQDEQNILVIDEYPYLAQSSPSISSLLQKLIDVNKHSSKLFLVLCGSSMSFMEHQVLGEKSPLYGRRTGQIKVEPFDIFEAAELLHAPNPLHAIELYSLVGGVPLYLEQLNVSKSTEWNMANALFRQGSFLSVEPENFLMQEMRSPATYNTIITAIANGNEKATDIANAAHISTAALNTYINNLIELGIVERTTPAIRGNRKQVLYKLKDNLFRFWYRFMPRYATALNAGMHENIAHYVAENELSTFVGSVFETVCRQWLKRKLISEGFILTSLGSWWGNDPIRKEQAEVDIVATGIDGELILGECKWRNSPIDTDTLNLLAQRASFLQDSKTSNLRLYLFSKSGFTEECKQKAKQVGNASLVKADSMFQILEQ